MKLYELASNYQKIYNMVDEEIDEQTWIDSLECIQGEIEVKTENIAKLIKMLDADSTILKAEEERLEKRRKTVENKVIRIKQYLQQQLEFSGLDKVKTPNFTISIQNNPPSVNILEEDIIPTKYIITKTENILDKKSLLADLKSGEKISGVELKQGRSLRIR